MHYHIKIVAVQILTESQ